MIQNLVKGLRSGISCNTFLYPPMSNLRISHRYEYNTILEKAKEDANEDYEKLIKFRQAEVHLWYLGGQNSINPEKVTEEQWQYIYELDSKHQRQKYCKYLNIKADAKADKKSKKLEQVESKKSYHEQMKAERKANTHIVYGLGHNTLHLRINKQTINDWLNYKLSRAKLFGQKIVVDCSYEDCMTRLEKSKVAKGLNRIYSENRKHMKPVDLHFCGVKAESAIMKDLYGQVPTLQRKVSLAEMHSQCFTELFPKERLVMLTPDSDNVLEYNFQDIYIVGGIVDFGRADPLTLAKGKQLGIRTARLPLDNIRLRQGDTRELTMSGAISIIREFQMTNDIAGIVRRCSVLKSDWKLADSIASDAKKQTQRQFQQHKNEEKIENVTNAKTPND